MSPVVLRASFTEMEWTGDAPRRALGNRAPESTGELVPGGKSLLWARAFR